MLTLITPHTPGRLTLADLAECVWNQTAQAEWSVESDIKGEGPSVLRNRMVETATTEWVNPIDDDDLLHDTYVEKVTELLTDDVDIVLAWCDLELAGHHEMSTHFQQPLDVMLERLRYDCGFPNCAAIRRSLWLDIGGQRDGEWEDWDFWLRAQAAGARFAQIPEPLWTYRLGDWPHRGGWSPEMSS